VKSLVAKEQSGEGACRVFEKVKGGERTMKKNEAIKARHALLETSVTRLHALLNSQQGNASIQHHESNFSLQRLEVILLRA
jgi:hypothetical protein